MRKLIMLAMVIGLLVVGEARADGAWVLWESSGSVNNQTWTWTIIGGYPLHNSCLQEEEAICMKHQQAWKSADAKASCSKSWGGHSLLVNTEGGKYYLWEWKCLPETVDPRK
jgi:hypothetical protein